MEDPRSFAVLDMAVRLIASGAPHYTNRSVGSVAAELLGTANGLDDAILGPVVPENQGTRH